ncbi:MAG: immunoglobulin-like domain-containing protein [Candidatus Kerfeldbacteria bacterium]
MNIGKKKLHIVLAGVVSLGVVLVSASAAFAALPNPTTFTVTKEADTADGTCDSDCSLREAVIAANANYGDDTIIVPAGTYDFAIAGRGEDAAATGDLDITDNLIIAGNSEGSTMISGEQYDRIFQIMSGVTVELHDVYLRNGIATASGASGLGGAIYNDGTLSVVDCQFVTNQALNVPVSGSGGSGYGGAIYNDGLITIISGTTFSYNYAVNNKNGPAGGYGGAISNTGAITEISDCVFENNWAAYNSSTHQTSGYGGAIYSTGAIATIDGSTFEYNKASQTSGGGTAYGGAIYNVGSTISTVSDTDFIDNVALINTHATTSSNGYGGAMYIDSAVTTMERLTFTGNVAKKGDGPGSGYGGAVGIASTVETIEDITVENNTALEHNGTGAGSGYGGGFWVQSVITSMSNATFSGNVAKNGSTNGSAYGGAIFDGGAITPFKNSTISGNTAMIYTGSGTPGCYGGGIYSDNSESSYYYLTITDNTAVDNTNGTPDVDGGGLYSIGEEGLTVRHLIISDNQDGLDTPATPDCFLDDTITNNGYNIIGDTTGCSWTDNFTDQLDTDPLLGPLEYNGGFNETHGLLDGSPAIDYIPGAICEFSEDQRDLARPQNTNCDVGAVERDQTDPTVTLTGSSTVTLECRANYTDAGGTINDNYARNLAAVVDDSAVNENAIGAYLVDLTVTDYDGNTGNTTRTVNVVDTTDPTVTRKGSSTVNVLQNATYTDAGATASDSCDTATFSAAGYGAAGTITTDNPVDTTTVGSYTVTYTAEDASGNTGTATRTVNVVSRGKAVQVTPLTDNRVKVKYEDDSTQTFTVFNKGTKTPRAQLSKNSNYVVVANRVGTKIKSIDAALGTTVSSRTLRKKQQNQVKMRVFNYYTSNLKNDVIVATRKGENIRTSHYTLTKNGVLTGKDTKKFTSSYTKNTYKIRKKDKNVKIVKKSGTLLVKYRVKKTGNLKDL